MNKFTAITVALLIGAVPVTTLAATTAPMAIDAQTTAVVLSHHSTVHHANGERFDVPNSLLRNRDTLINGLPPESAQFE